jgi:TRAP-type C4-dicarboxylate transport system substrate-binding protein
MKKSKKLVLSGLFVLVVFTGTILFTSPVFASAAKPIELKYAILEGSQSARTKYGHEVWADMINKATKGKVKATIFPGASLAGARQVYDACVNGIVDILYLAIPHYPGRFPLSEALIHPGSNMVDPILASKVAMKMYDKYPQMQKEFKQVKFLFIYGYAPISVATVKKPVHKLEDIKGLRLRVAQKSIGDLIKLAGASPVFLKPADIFMNLQKGVIDGSIMGWSGHRAFGTNKLANYFTVVPAFPGPFFLFGMNKGKWNKLPPDVQEGIMSVSGDVGSQLFAKSALKETEISTKDIRDNPKKEIIQLSQEEIDKWTALSKPVQDKMISKLEKKGRPGKQFFEDIGKLVKEYK